MPNRAKYLWFDPHTDHPYVPQCSKETPFTLVVHYTMISLNLTEEVILDDILYCSCQENLKHIKTKYSSGQLILNSEVVSLPLQS